MTPPPIITEAPPLHFLVLDFNFICQYDHFRFDCTTDVPCNMTMHLGLQKPIIRNVPSRKRGSSLQSSSLTCFTALEANLQQEPGDTLVHTWVKPLFQYCQPHYFYLTATHNGVPSKSISQFFSVHCKRPPYPPTQAYEVSIPFGNDGAGQARTYIDTAQYGYGSSADFVAISDHPLNRIHFHARRAHPRWSKCGLNVRLYPSTFEGKPFGDILTQGNVPASDIPDDFSWADINLDLDKTDVIGGWRYVWMFFNLEEGEPARLTSFHRTWDTNYDTTKNNWWLRKNDFAVYAYMGNVCQFFENWWVAPETEPEP